MKVFNVLKKVSFLLLVVVICSFTVERNIPDQSKQNTINQSLQSSCIKIYFSPNLGENNKNRARQNFSTRYQLSFISLISSNGDTEEWYIQFTPNKREVLLGTDDNDDTHGGIVKHEFKSCDSRLISIRK